MTHYHSSFDAGGARTETRSRFGKDVRNLGDRFCSYVRRLTAEQWMLFLAGVIVGLILG
jgi:hypothetical protein